MNNTNTAKQVTCSKCDGLGKLRAFGHIENGKCFLCGGAGKIDACAARVTTQRVQSPAEIEAYKATQRAHYKRHYATACKHIPGLTLVEFKQMVQPIADKLRAEDYAEQIMPYHWADAAYYAVADF